MGVSADVEEESQRYGDIIVEDFMDTYNNLRLKTIFILKWVHLNCPKLKFIMKVDDDVFVNVPNLQNTLVHSRYSTNLIMGSLICDATPNQRISSKHCTPHYMYNEKYISKSC